MYLGRFYACRDISIIIIIIIINVEIHSIIIFYKGQL